MSGDFLLPTPCTGCGNPTGGNHFPGCRYTTRLFPALRHDPNAPCAGTHRGPEGPDEDVGQCSRCGHPMAVPRTMNRPTTFYDDDDEDDLRPVVSWPSSGPSAGVMAAAQRIEALRDEYERRGLITPSDYDDLGLLTSYVLGADASSERSA